MPNGMYGGVRGERKSPLLNCIMLREYYGLATVGKILFGLSQTLYSNKKVWSTFSKAVGVGKAHKDFKV